MKVFRIKEKRQILYKFAKRDNVTIPCFPSSAAHLLLSPLPSPASAATEKSAVNWFGEYTQKCKESSFDIVKRVQSPVLRE